MNIRKKPVSMDWVLNQLAGMKFPNQGQAYDFIKESWAAAEKADFANVYDPEYGDDRLCTCGHPYYRHFDSYDDMEPVGCKYCPTYDAEHGNSLYDYVGHDTCPNGFTQADESKTAKELQAEAIRTAKVIKRVP